MKVKIDMNKYERAEAFYFFDKISFPFYSVSFNEDVTKLYDYVKKNNLSFYYSLIYLCTKAINSVEDFLLTTNGTEIYKLDKRIPSFTDLKSGSKSFHIVTMPISKTMEDFTIDAKNKSQSQNAFLDQNTETDDLIYFSCLPWLETTSVTNERDLTGNYKDDCIPRVCWGKYKEENGKKTLNFSVEVNHRLIDGFHIGKFHEVLTSLINELN